MNHLRYEHYVNNYVPGFHRMAQYYLTKCKTLSPGYDKFVEKMDNHFKDSKKYKTYWNKENALENFIEKINKQITRVFLFK